jgi:hypothetical protein
MSRSSLRRVFRPVIIGMAALAIPLSAELPAAAATTSPVSPAAVSTVQHPSGALAPANFPPADDFKTQFLTATPVASDPNSCVSRSIGLAAGEYSWTYKMGGETITLSGSGLFISHAGTYSWETCLFTDDGFYQLASSLTSSAKDGDGDPIEVHDLQDTFIQLHSSGDYTWGSVLTPSF